MSGARKEDRRVIVVDDSMLVTRLMKTELSPHYHVETTDSATELVSLVTEPGMKPTIVLMDVGAGSVRAVLEVFSVVYSLLGRSGESSHLRVSLAPKFIAPIERWLNDRYMGGAGRQTNTEKRETLHERLVLPLITQVEIDAGALAARAATERLQPGAAAGSPHACRIRP